MRTNFITVLATLLLPSLTAAAAVINVPADQPTIQAGINAAMAGDEVVVASGTYMESIDFMGKAITVRGASGDPADTTIDGTGSFHVVQFVSGEGAGSVLSAFTITGGSANGTSPDDWGGGLYISGGGPTISNCRIEGNSASVGGGAYVSSSGASTTFTDCAFVSNDATDFAGGAYAEGAVVLRCSFEGNTAVTEGGGYAGWGTFVESTFIGNTAMGFSFGAGALFLGNFSSEITSCTFDGNQAPLGEGGALHAFGPGKVSAIVTNSLFVNNSAGEGGGAIFAQSVEELSVSNCTFSGNSTTQTLSANAGETPTAGAIAAEGIASGFAEIDNCILWGNTAGGAPKQVAGPAACDHCNIEGSGGSGAGWDPGVGTDLGGNIDTDPCFVDAAGGDLRLSRYSPCVDAGSNDLVPVDVNDLDGDMDTAEKLPLDLDGQPRFVDDAGVTDTGDAGAGPTDVVDMGAFERLDESLPMVINLTPADSISDTVAKSFSGDEIVLAPGTYPITATIDFGGRDITLRGSTGDPAMHVLDGSVSPNAVITLDSGEGPGSVLEFLTVSGQDSANTAVSFGNASPVVRHCVFSNNEGASGGAVEILGGNPKFSDCDFVSNRVDNLAGGAGVWIDSTTLTSFRRCRFLSNEAIDQLGGGVLLDDGEIHVVGCEFSSNTAFAGGGMSFGNAGFGTIANTVFLDNEALSGGALYMSSDPTTRIVNCRFEGNSSTQVDGGAISLVGEVEDLRITNCTFSGNTAPSQKVGGISSSLTTTIPWFLDNCIIWGNSVNDSGEQIRGNTNIQIAFSDIQDSGGSGAWTLVATDVGGNIDADPLFVDAIGGDLRLAPFSPCLDAGSNALLPADVADVDDDGDIAEELPIDLDGGTRRFDQPPFIGPDTGSGTAPLVDIGAYELPVQTPTAAYWASPGTSEWSVDGNWLDASQPDVLDSATFDNTVVLSLPNSYTVTLSSDETVGGMSVLTDWVTLLLQSNDLMLPTDGGSSFGQLLVGQYPNLPGESVRLFVKNEFALPGTVSVNQMMIADSGMSEARLEVAEGSSTSVVIAVASDAVVGSLGNGKLFLDAGGEVQIGGDLVIGASIGANGEVLVSGVGADLSYTNPAATITVGDFGTGTLRINQSAEVSPSVADEVFIGRRTGSIGIVELDGGSTWTTDVSSFIVGDDGDATMTISGGAAVTTQVSGEVSIGRGTDGSGAVTITGAGSEWNVIGTAVTLGDGGNGSITVCDGGVLDVLNINVFVQGTLGGCSEVTASVFNIGTVDPDDGAGGTGVFTINGGYQQIGPVPGGNDESGRLTLTLNGTTPGTGFDQLVVNGQAELGGGVVVDLGPMYDPLETDSFEFIAATTIDSTNDEFDAVLFPDLPSQRNLRVQYPAALVGGSPLIVVDPLAQEIDLGPDLDSSPIPDDPAGAALADIDGDTFIDLVVTNAATNEVTVVFNGGLDMGGAWLGFTGGVSSTTVGMNPGAVIAATLDGDATIDLAVANVDDDTVTFLFNDGLEVGTWETPVVVAVGDMPSDLAPVDVDGDGDLDVAVTNEGSDELILLINDTVASPESSTAAFNPLAPIATGDGPSGVDPDDVDDDKDEDIVVTDAGSGDVRIFFNDGTGNLTEPLDPIPVGAEPRDVRVCNLNNDAGGFPEIVVSNFGDGTLSLILNEGTVPGTPIFKPPVTFDVGDAPGSLAIADLDMDADDDILVLAGAGTPLAQSFRNDTPTAEPLAFTDDDDFAAGAQPVFILTGDVDNDGCPDVVSVNGPTPPPPGAPAPPGPAFGSADVRLNGGAPPPPCDGDTNGDNVINIDDIVNVVLDFGCTQPPDCPNGGDVNGDDVVNIDDIVFVVLNFGNTCPGS